jgi:hypothetical protein
MVGAAFRLSNKPLGSKKREAPLAGALPNGEALKRRLQMLSLGWGLIQIH